MFFSIIIPAYNIEKYLRKCLDSIRNQTFKDYEAIIVDDGSTDNTSIICDEYSAKDKRFKVIHKKNGGLVSARKAGAKHVKGEYVVAVDGDDEIENNFLFELYKKIGNKNPDMVAFGYRTVNEEGSVLTERHNDADNGFYTGRSLDILKSKFLYDESRKGINDGNLIFSTWSKAIKSSIYKESIIEVDDRIVKGEDLIALLYLMQRVKSVMIVDCFGYHYRIQQSSIMHKYHIKDLYRLVILRNEIYKAVKKNKSMINQVSVCLFYTTFERLQELVEAETKYKEFKKYIRVVRKYHLFDCITNMYCKYPSYKERIKLLLIKNGWWMILYIYIRIHKIIKKRRASLK